MKEIGAILKAAREEKGLSLDEIQMVTKIRYKHLEALEAGDFDMIPGEVYVKGFLVNFAKNVGLDSDQILHQYYDLKKQELQVEEDSVTQEKGTSAALTETVTTENVAARKPSPKKSAYLVPGVIGLLIVAGSVLWALLPSEPAPESLTAPQGETPPVVENENVLEGVAEEERNIVQTSPTEEEREVVLTAEPQLIAQASEVVWLGVYGRDSQRVIFEGTLYPEERQEWVLTEDVNLRIGNAGGLQLSYRGEDLGQLGYSGQVINKVLTID